MSKKVEKYLKMNKWYHATTLSGWKEICKYKIQASYNIGNELDFGYGFYLTPKLDQAEKFIKRMIEIPEEDLLSEIDLLYPTKNNPDDKIAVIVEFNFVPYDWYIDDSLEHKILSNYDDEFAEFVFFNRTENANGLNQHIFDFMFGVMSDSNPNKEIKRFRSGIIGKDEVIESFKTSTSSKQLSIHNQSLCDTMKPSRAFIIDTGKELDINDYTYSTRHEYAR